KGWAGPINEEEGQEEGEEEWAQARAPASAAAPPGTALLRCSGFSRMPAQGRRPRPSHCRRRAGRSSKGDTSCTADRGTTPALAVRTPSRTVVPTTPGHN